MATQGVYRGRPVEIRDHLHQASDGRRVHIMTPIQTREERRAGVIHGWISFFEWLATWWGLGFVLSFPIQASETPTAWNEAFGASMGLSLWISLLIWGIILWIRFLKNEAEWERGRGYVPPSPTAPSEAPTIKIDDPSWPGYDRLLHPEP